MIAYVKSSALQRNNTQNLSVHRQQITWYNYETASSRYESSGHPSS